MNNPKITNLIPGKLYRWKTYHNAVVYQTPTTEAMNDNIALLTRGSIILFLDQGEHFVLWKRIIVEDLVGWAAFGELDVEEITPENV